MPHRKYFHREKKFISLKYVAITSRQRKLQNGFIPYYIISGYIPMISIITVKRSTPFSILFELLVDVFFIVVKGTDNVIMLYKKPAYIASRKRSDPISLIDGELIIVASKRERNDNHVINFIVILSNNLIFK